MDERRDCTWRVSLARPTDAGTAARLFALQAVELGGVVLDAERLAETMATLLSDGQHFALLAEVPADPRTSPQEKHRHHEPYPAAGMCLVDVRPDLWTAGLAAEVRALFVAPELRRRGLGRALLEETAVQARRRGCSYLYLLTEQWNTPATALFAAQGMQSKDARYFEWAL